MWTKDSDPFFLPDPDLDPGRIERSDSNVSGSATIVSFDLNEWTEGTHRMVL